jgi:hypothetical protein
VLQRSPAVVQMMGDFHMMLSAKLKGEAPPTTSMPTSGVF